MSSRHEGHRARKRFSQNFLVDENVLRRIAATIGPNAKDQMLEIGPGTGALTAWLYREVAKFRVVEIDRDLIARLRLRWPDLDILEGDVLRVPPADLFAVENPTGQPWRVVGNLPYNISTPLVFRLLEQASGIKDMHFMLQEEVVQRMAAAPGTSAWGRLSVMTQYRCQVDALLPVPPDAFQPAPKVQSRIVRLTPQPPALPADQPLVFDRVVRLAFSQRRKTLRNGLKILQKEAPEALDLAADVVDLRARAETLSVADFVALANVLAAVLPQTDAADTTPPDGLLPDD